MGTTKKYGKPGYQWRILAHRDEHSRVTLANDGRFDELVLDRWLHIEQMSERAWWMRIGDAYVWVEVSQSGNARSVWIRRGEYGPVKGGPTTTSMEHGRLMSTLAGLIGLCEAQDKLIACYRAGRDDNGAEVVAVEEAEHFLPQAIAAMRAEKLRVESETTVDDHGEEE